MAFKDLFSPTATTYAQYRPTYPAELFSYLARLTPTHELAWDAGCGSGQASLDLATIFKRVYATDPAAAQIQNATRSANVSYKTEAAEACSLADDSVDLVVAAQSFHWMQPEAFFSHVQRVLNADGKIAIWCYGLCTISPTVDAAIQYLYHDLLGDVWEPERRLVEQGYLQSPFPFQEITAPKFDMKANWTLPQLVGYLRTWSASQTYQKKNAIDPVRLIDQELADSWGPEPSRIVRWEISIRVGERRP